MRVVASKSFTEFNVTVYSWNGKYILKFEQNLLEQTYKIPETDFSGEAEINNLLNTPNFIKEIAEQFIKMRNILADAHESLL
jgi:hypothetical protein